MKYGKHGDEGGDKVKPDVSRQGDMFDDPLCSFFRTAVSFKVILITMPSPTND
jgi:hypothetical protein